MSMILYAHIGRFEVSTSLRLSTPAVVILSKVLAMALWPTPGILISLVSDSPLDVISSIISSFMLPL